MTSDPLPDWKTSSDEAKRTLILDAALRVFGRRGFAEPNMDDVAEEADYTRRSLYRFFASKEELGMALAVRCCRLLSDTFEPSTASFDAAWTYWRLSQDRPLEFRVILETRELMVSGRTLPLRQEWLAADGLGSWLTSQDGVGREAMAAALGYVEFRFRYGAVWQESGLAGDDGAVKTVLERILKERA